jgi:hypothetical protein
MASQRPTVWFEVLFVFVVLARDRRRVLHFNVTAHPTAGWTAQQIVEVFPFETVPKYLLRDRDAIYGHVFQQQIEAMVLWRYSELLDHLGNVAMSNESSARFAATVSTT